MHKEDLLSLNEVIAKYGYSKAYWYKLTSSKSIKHYKLGKMVFFSEVDIEKHLTPMLVEEVED